MIPLPGAAGPPSANTQWPRLVVNDARVLAVWWQGHGTRSTQPPDKRPRSDAAPRMPLPTRLLRAPIYGAVLGLLAASAVYGVWPARHWWLADWHWAIALGAVLLLALVSFNAAALAAAGIALVQGASVGVQDIVLGGLPALTADLRDVGKAILILIAVRVAWEILLSPLRPRRP